MKFFLKQKGLTLIELLAVIAIIAILFILLIPSISSAMEKSRQSGLLTDFRSYEVGVKSYFMQEGNNQKTIEGLNENLDKNLRFKEGISLEKNPYGNPYEIVIENNEKIIIKTKDNSSKSKEYGLIITSEDGEIESSTVGFDTSTSKEDNDSSTIGESGNGNEENIVEQENAVEPEPVVVLPTCVTEANPKSDFEFSPVFGGVSITNYLGSSANVKIPCEIDGEKVVEIASTTWDDQKSFFGKSLTSVVLPETIRAIGDNAFRNNQITSINMPRDLTSIGNMAFTVNQLGNLSIPNGVTALGESAFESSGITNLTLPNTLSSIGRYTFARNSFSSVVIPASLKTIPQYAFTGNGISSITLSEGVLKIEAAAFETNNIVSLTLPSSLTSLGNNAFYKNTLSAVSAPSSIKSIIDAGSNIFKSSTGTTPNISYR